ncbi:spermidine dehydrogenase SpdH [Kordiimonas sediminis]|uniref:Spermidine dehydrogenase SpdH n=1 Tax=Kordiimonas sediminis TaxID=1735581 RepID=A0A919AXV8_9PROT|nr:FAD/NAD(P)-binding protein [Kordiimonas sediminis]GHF30900.1 spermidine dehydrogenase SpdH [Kordiimonas sediminis]
MTKKCSQKSNINRRDFLSGVALTGVALGMSPLDAVAQGLVSADGVWTYPPAKTGLRGNHVGSFEVAHAISWEGKQYDRPKKIIDDPYDLVIVGGGISGLSAAHLARKKLGEKAKILILDNHDDFGGHAKRNEFKVDGKTLIGYGGSQSIDTPSSYSDEAMGVLTDIGIDTEKFYRYYDRSFFARNKLGSATFLPATGTLHRRSTRGMWTWETEEEKAELIKVIASLPLSQSDKEAAYSLWVDNADWLSDMTREDKISYLRSTAYLDCLKKYAGVSDDFCDLIRDEEKGYWGFGWDALSGLEAVRLWRPETYGLGLDPATVPDPYTGEDPYIFHFPDGNAGIARLLVARLVPDALDRNTMETVVKTQVHYDRLDRVSNPTRIRLNSTVVNASNTKNGAEITYVRDGKVERVVATKAIMACYNHILPHIMSDMPDTQKEALQEVEKIPLCYINVAVRNWKPWATAGIQEIYAPEGIIYRATLDFPVSMGGYLYPESPEEPALLHLVHIPNVPGLTPKEQHRGGRYEMYGLTFADYEEAIRDFLTGALGQYGFDFDRDVADITVNRWPHGYAYEYNELYDDPSFGPYHGSKGGEDKGPHVLGRQTVGNIAIANSDAAAYAYVNGAIDAAALAVKELYG